MSGSVPDSGDVARLLRQRSEVGGTDLFLDGLSRDEALALARKLRDRRRAAPKVEASAAGQPAAAPAGAATWRQKLQDAPEEARGTAAPPPPRIALPGSYTEVRDAALACTRCRLSESRGQVVFSDGAVDARLVVVGEAPGANEDATGLPFVGAAGQYLDLLLATVDLSRKESVYICNVLKCRPPGNRNPLPDEIEQCTPFLEKQLELIAPQALLAVGTFAAQALTGQSSALGKLRGKVHSYRGIPLVVTYHPAALLRNSGWTRSFWEDLQLLRTIMDKA